MELDARSLNENFLPGPWWIRDDDDVWQLFAPHPLNPRLHPMQVIKAPKKSIEYACYWPEGINEKIIAAAPLLYEAALAGQEYDRATRKCANDPEKMASFCPAQGDTLDDLYMDWMTKIAYNLAPRVDFDDPDSESYHPTVRFREWSGPLRLGLTGSKEDVQRCQ